MKKIYKQQFLKFVNALVKMQSLAVLISKKAQLAWIADDKLEDIKNEE